MKKLLAFLIITVQLPGLAQNGDFANLKKYASQNKSLPLAVANETRVVLMGDSITEFWQTTDPGFFAGKPYINRGISGQTTSQMLLRFRQDVIDLNPSVVVILAGINDIAENNGPIAVGNIFKNIISMAESAKQHKIKVVLCSVLPANAFPWRPELKPAGKIILLNAKIRTYAKANNIPYVDYYAKMVNKQKGLDKKLAEDGVHPTRAGYKVMAPLFEKAIAKASGQK